MGPIEGCCGVENRAMSPIIYLALAAYLMPSVCLGLWAWRKVRSLNRVERESTMTRLEAVHILLGEMD